MSFRSHARNPKGILPVLLAITAIAIGPISAAEEGEIGSLETTERNSALPTFKGTGVSLGYSRGSLDAKDAEGSYEVIPIKLRLIYDIKPTADEWLNLRPKGDLDLLVEPFFNPVTNPNEEYEVGFGIFLRYSLFSSEKDSRLNPFIDAGAGGIYTSTDWEDSTQLNFLAEAGVGLDYRLSDRGNKLFVGFRGRHYSNAGINGTNHGENNYHLYIGYSWESQE